MFGMGNDVKKDLKKIAKDTQTSIVRSLLSWKYKRDGLPVPDDEMLQMQSRQISRRANDLILGRGKGVWNEVKKAYNEGRNSRKESDK